MISTMIRWNVVQYWKALKKHSIIFSCKKKIANMYEISSPVCHGPFFTLLLYLVQPYKLQNDSQSPDFKHKICFNCDKDRNEGREWSGTVAMNSIGWWALSVAIIFVWLEVFRGLKLPLEQFFWALKAFVSVQQYQKIEALFKNCQIVYGVKHSTLVFGKGFLVLIFNL